MPTFPFVGFPPSSRTSLISFITRITASRRLLPVKFDSYAISELSSALESNDIESLATDVPAAAQWIFHTGHLVYHLNHEYEPHGASGGPLWGGKRGFCVDRWNLWEVPVCMGEYVVATS